MYQIEINTIAYPNWKAQLLSLSADYTYACILDSKAYTGDLYSNYDYLAGFGAKSIVVSDSWEQLKALVNKKCWLFGMLGYDLKNQNEALTSSHDDLIGFPDLCFFEPEIVVQEKDGKVWITGSNAYTEVRFLEAFYEQLKLVQIQKPARGIKIDLQAKISKEKYLKQIIQLKNHIQLGDIFEVNFCHEFFAENVSINPPAVFARLMEESPTPFANFLKLDQRYCMGASPERFLQKKGNKIISQPIKGTAKRGSTEQEDEAIKKALSNNTKERSENVMIVDLVRNDLSKFAQNGSVKVEELYGIYSFPQVHQMISTVSCEVGQDHPVDVIRNCFPMGSMTGAPKVEAMKLIESFECTKRGLFSGSVGYFSPVGDFDFNVVIRSLLYSNQNKALSFSVGSAITHRAGAEQEYEETLLKAQAIMKVLNN